MERAYAESTLLEPPPARAAREALVIRARSETP